MIVEIKEEFKSGTDLSLGQGYRVISMDFIRKSEVPNSFEIRLRLLNDSGTAALYKVGWFTVTDPSMEADFVHKSYFGESFGFLPKSMSYPRYWDDFFDEDEKAVAIFNDRFPEYKDKVSNRD